MPQRGMAGAEIVERDAAPRLTQRIDKARRLHDVAECGCLGDLDDEAGRQVGAAMQQRYQRLEPGSIANRQSGNVEPEPDLGIGSEFIERLFEDITIDDPDEAKLFESRDELGGGDDIPLLVAHSQQALEIIDLPGPGADNGLEREQKPILA